MNEQHVVIIGCGFGGFAAAKSLVGTDVQVTLIDQANHHLFQPLLYQVATGDLSPSDIAWPIRSLFAKAKNIRVVQAEVTQVDRIDCTVKTTSETYKYDYLVVASGADNSYFGHDHWQNHAPGLKDLSDALNIRKRIFSAFEQAEVATDQAEQQRCMTFVVIGGGPTGVEMAGAIAEIARSTLAKDFRRIDPSQARIVLIEGANQVLNGFAEKLSKYTSKALQKMGVELMLGSFVDDIQSEQVVIGDKTIAAKTIIWGAGVKPQVSMWLHVPVDKNGRVPVDAYLNPDNDSQVFVIGDAAQVEWQDGLSVPGIAPAAKQQGQYVGKRLRGLFNGRVDKQPFKYKHAGHLATIGRHKAVVDLGFMKFKGWPAWYFWGLIHIYFLIGVRSAWLILTQWFWTYLTRRKPARLIISSKAKNQHKKHT